MPLEMHLKKSSCRLLKYRQLWKKQNEIGSLCPLLSALSTGSVGRPRVEISKDQLEYLVEYELKTPDIAEALGVSVSTIKRRLREFNISIRGTLAEISDDDLDSVLRSIHRWKELTGQTRLIRKLISVYQIFQP